MSEGSVYALLGPKGAGKSTMLQILMNLLKANAGRAEVFGHSCQRLSSPDFTQIGFIAEGQGMPNGMTVPKFMNYLQPFCPNWMKNAPGICFDSSNFRLKRYVAKESTRRRCGKLCAELSYKLVDREWGHAICSSVNLLFFTSVSLSAASAVVGKLQLTPAQFPGVTSGELL